jgi:hypothetical protein
MKCHFSSGNLAFPDPSLSRIEGSGFSGKGRRQPCVPKSRLRRTAPQRNPAPPRVALCLSEIWRGPTRECGRMTTHSACLIRRKLNRSQSSGHQSSSHLDDSACSVFLLPLAFSLEAP